MGSLDWSILWRAPYSEQIGAALRMTVEIAFAAWVLGVYAAAAGLVAAAAWWRWVDKRKVNRGRRAARANASGAEAAS